jgi:hypothetical protein
MASAICGEVFGERRHHRRPARLDAEFAFRAVREIFEPDELVRVATGAVEHSFAGIFSCDLQLRSRQDIRLRDGVGRTAHRDDVGPI